MRPRALPRAFAFILALAALSAARPAGTLDLTLPGPAPRAPLEPVSGIGLPTDESCARCHAEIASEWKTSLHHHAWENEYFVRAYAVEPLPFCRKCHAPSVDPATEPTEAARALGVGCSTCHVVPSGIVGVRDMARGSTQAIQNGGHDVIGDARLATPAACGRCHEFAFPGPPGVDFGLMQNTIGEHRRSAAANTSCQHCHMPAIPSRGGGTHHSHDFRVQGDRAMLAKAVIVKSAVLRGDAMHVELSPGAIGHAFPTGDLNRQVDVRAIPIDTDAAGTALGPGSHKTLGRTFGPTRKGPSTFVPAERTDTRLASPRTLVLPLPKGTQRARYQIVWQKLPPKMAPRLGLKMEDHEMVVLEGIVDR